MKLFHSPLSPYVRKVMVVLHETGQHDAVEIVAATGTPLDPATMPLAENPLGKIPCLTRPDAPALYDSRVICRFLDDRTGGRLYPAAPRLWDTLTLEATGDGIADAALLMIYEARLRPEQLRMVDYVEGQWHKIARALDTLERRWLAHLAGPFDMGQVAVGCALGYLDLRHGARAWRDGRPGLAAWYAALGERPAMVATRPEG